MHKRPHSLDPSNTVYVRFPYAYFSFRSEIRIASSFCTSGKTFFSALERKTIYKRTPGKQKQQTFSIYSTPGVTRLYDMLKANKTWRGSTVKSRRNRSDSFSRRGMLWPFRHFQIQLNFSQRDRLRPGNKLIGGLLAGPQKEQEKISKQIFYTTVPPVHACQMRLGLGTN